MALASVLIFGAKNKFQNYRLLRIERHNWCIVCFSSQDSRGFPTGIGKWRSKFLGKYNHPRGRRCGMRGNHLSRLFL